jgi:hypothetical protein
VATIPSAATQIRPPEDITTQLAKAIQIRSMIFGQQLTAADLQQKNLSNQQLAATLDGQKRLQAAQNDPAWNPTDTDAATKLLQHYQVPLDVAGKVIAGIGQIRTGLQQQSSENIGNIKNAHDFLDDQLQATKNAPLDKRQSAYESGIENARNYANLLPDGHAKVMFLSELAGAPPIYDAQWVNQKHSELRTMAQLAEEGLNAAKTREAAGKGAEAEAAAAKIRGEGAPGSPFFAPTPQATALGAQQGVPWANAVQTGEAAQAGAKAGAEAKAKLPYEVQAEVAKQVALQKMNPAAVAGVAPHLVTAATNAYDKAGQEYATAYQAAQNMADFLTAAKGGNKEAVKIVPLQGALEITTAQGVHRINRTEVDQFGGAGNLYDKLAGKVGGVLTGKDITDSVLNDMAAVQQTVSQNAAKLHANKVATINASYGSKFQPMSFGPTPGGSNTTKPEGATGKAKGPDGKWHWADEKGTDYGLAE